MTVLRRIYLYFDARPDTELRPDELFAILKHEGISRLTLPNLTDKMVEAVRLGKLEYAADNGKFKLKKVTLEGMEDMASLSQAPPHREIELDDPHLEDDLPFAEQLKRADKRYKQLLDMYDGLSDGTITNTLSAIRKMHLISRNISYRLRRALEYKKLEYGYKDMVD